LILTKFPANGACIFDMDGVVVESLHAHFEAWKTIVGRYGGSLTLSRFRNEIFGMRNEDTVGMLIGKKVSEPEIERLCDEKENLFREYATTEMTLVPGILDLLTSLKNLNIKTGLATSAPTLNAEVVLEHFKMQDLFDTIMAGEHVTNGKPEPEIFLKSAESLGASAADCVVFEDSEPGVIAGVKAGSIVVGVTTMHDEEALHTAGAKACVPDFINTAVKKREAVVELVINQI